MKLTNDEARVLSLLAEAWNEFVRLEVQHPCDTAEFMTAIHAAQNIVMARLAARSDATFRNMLGTK